MYLLEHQIDLSEAAKLSADMGWVPAMLSENQGLLHKTADDLVESKSGDWYNDWHDLKWPDGRVAWYRSYEIGAGNRFLGSFRIIEMQPEQLTIGYAPGVWE